VLTASAVLGVACILTAIVCVTFGFRLLAFQSGSMSPTIDTGSLALARTVDAGDLAKGDVVSVHTATGSRVTHRIVGLQSHGHSATLELRGDANPVADAAPYTVSRADRVLFSVPYVGYLGSLLTSPLGLVMLGVYLCFLLSVLFERPRPPRSARRRDGPDPAESGSAPTAAVLTVLSLVVAAAVGTSVLTIRSGGTLAFWTDPVTPVTTGALATATIAAPATFTCGGIGALGVTFNWAAVPGATSYTVHYGSNGGSTVTTTGTTATVLSLGLGTAWVTATFGSTTWTSTASPTRTYLAVGLTFCR
jgi:signal peptidase I